LYKISQLSRTGWNERAYQLVLFLGIALRFWAFLTIDLLPVSDFKKYYELALNFSEFGTLSLHGQVFSFQPPLYPWLLGAIFYIFEPTVLVAKYANLVFSCLSAFVYFALIKKLFDVSKSGLLALVLFLLFPPVALYLQVLGVETLAILIICLIMYLTQVRLTNFVEVVIGVLFFALNMTRPQYVMVSILIIVFYIVKEGRGRWMLFAFLFLSVIYSYRNYLTHSAFVPLSSNSGYVLLVNNNDQNTRSGWMPLAKLSLAEKEKRLINNYSSIDMFSDLDEDYKTLFWTPESDKVARELAIGWIYNNPEKFIELAKLRLARGFLRVSEEVLGWVYYKGKAPSFMVCISNLMLLISYFGAIAGLFNLHVIKNLPIRIILPSLIFFYIISLFIFEGQGRYYLPMHPVVCVLLGVAVFRCKLPKGFG
jgi:4-amino-4-deoxy-L-arabinose transferase-like glycosyltransferase